MWIEWADSGTLSLACPACGSSAPKRRQLSVRWAAPRSLRWGYSSPGPLTLLRCPDCESAFYDSLAPAQYDDPGFGGIKFHVEQGAGIDAMLKPLCRFDPARVRRYLEIGCGFGYSLDFARFAFGWQVRGLDPSSLAAAGRDALHLDITSAYLGPETEYDGLSSDLVHCSEVIEHIADPHAFLTLARRVVAPHGALSLTTPNAAGIRPDTSSGELVPILSPGQHLILFTKASLERILRATGFPHVQVWERPVSLHAVASSEPYPLRDTADVEAALYLRYLADRAATVPPGTPIAAGFDYRLFKAAVCVADVAAAQPAHDRLRAAYAERYGLDLAAPHDIDVGPRARGSFDEFARACPFNLTGVLFFQGIVAMNHRVDYGFALESFRATARAGVAIRTALRAIGADDGETEDLGWHARTHVMYCLAHLDPAAAVREMAALRAGPGPADPPAELGRVPADIVTEAGIELLKRLSALGHEAEASRLASLLEEPRATPPPGMWQRLWRRARQALARRP